MNKATLQSVVTFFHMSCSFTLVSNTAAAEDAWVNQGENVTGLFSRGHGILNNTAVFNTL